MEVLFNFPRRRRRSPLIAIVDTTREDGRQKAALDAKVAKLLFQKAD